jgi:tetratricopeptide (TPR) repeat protein
MPLFVQRAQQANAHFVVDDETTTAVQQICQSVQGLPLGIELAAAWVRTLSCAEIAAKVNQSLAILSDQVDDHPHRHQSLQAVFDSSWRMLTTAEQDALLKLAVFQGGFERQAAQQVAGATLPLLAGLLDKSLLVRDETDGRYALLEVLRQLIQEKWTPQLKQTVRTAHCHYYAEFVAAGRLAASLAQEMDNVRLAWHTAVQHHPQWIPQFLDELHAVYRTSAWLQEGYDAWATATNKLLHSPQLVAKLQARQAELAISLGRFDEAKKLLESSLATIRPLNDKVELASVLYHLGRATFMNGDVQKSENFARESYHLYVQLDSPVGMAKTLRTQGSIASAKGQYDLATDYHMQSLAIYRQTDDGKALASTLNSLASNYCEIGNWQEALPLYEESLAMYRQINHLFHIAALLNNIGTVQVATKQFEQAEQNYQESAAICRQIGDGAGIAIALMNRGISALNQEDYARAEGYLLESIALYKDNSYPYMETIALQNMGVVAFHLQQYEAAEQYSLGAIRLALASEAMGLVANTLDNVARLRAHDGDYEAAMVLVAFVLHSDLSNQEAKDRTQQLEADLLPTMTAAQVERARENGRSLTLDAILAQISNL